VWPPAATELILFYLPAKASHEKVEISAICEPGTGRKEVHS